MAESALTLALRAALGIFLPLTVLAQAETGNYEDDELVIEEIIVTGSRIERTGNTQSQEVVRFTAEEMISSGDISVAEVLRSSTLNSFGSLADEPLTSAQANATLDLRGVGASRNLVILNGRRTVGSPALMGGGAVNLNMMPFAAVDRIEIIADGASAVYGSDAIAGVTNIVLKRDYEGLTFQARYGDRSEDDGTEESVSVLLGARGDRASLTFSLEYDKRDPIYDADRDYFRPRWGDYNGDGAVMGYEESIGVSPFGYLLFNPDWDADTPFDPEDQSTWPRTPGAGCAEGGGWAGVMKADYAFGPDAGYYCGYAYGLISTFKTGLERVISFVSAEYELTDSIDLFADVLMSQIESFGRWAPLATPGPAIPGDPRNDIGAAWGWFRYEELGPRDLTYNDTLTDINIGARGEFGASVSWDVYYTYSDYISAGFGEGFASWAGLSYNLANGVEDPDQFIGNMKATTLKDLSQDLQKVFAGMQFDLFNLQGGMVTAYTGAEHFKVDYEAMVDAQTEADLVGGASGDSAWGSRDVTALFAEAILPVFDWWEIDLALRYDDYSDFGSSTSPRVGTVVQVPNYDALRFKASWGEGFRAPDLSDLFGISKVYYQLARDFYGCQINGISEVDCHQIYVEVSEGSNPDLGAENSETWSVGVDWQFAEHWLASVNYFNLEITDRIVYGGVEGQLMVDYFTGGNNPNVQRNVQGYAEKVDTRVRNSFVPLNYDSVDFALSGGFDTGMGQFGLQIHASKYITYELEKTLDTGETINGVGYVGAPEWRGNLLLQWALNDTFASLNWDYVGSQTDYISHKKMGAWNIVNVQLGYDFGKFGTFSLGANNVLNESPDLDELGFPIQQGPLYDFTGRTIFLSYRVEQ